MANTLAKLRAKYPPKQEGVWQARALKARGAHHLGFYAGPFAQVVDQVVEDHPAKFIDGKVCGDIELFTKGST